MFFSKLPQNVKDAICKFPTDEVFQDRFGHDKVLDDLERQLYSEENCMTELNAFIGKPIQMFNVKWNNITPAKWAFLYACKNPIVNENGKEISLTDANFFLYVIQNYSQGDEPTTVGIKSLDYSKLIGLDEEAVFKVIHSLISIAFAPLEMFPAVKTEGAKEKNIFDMDWLTSIISIVHSMTGNSPEKIMNMSMNTCCYYFVQKARMNGQEHIEKKPKEEIIRQQDERACQLVIERLIELDVVKKEEYSELLKIMTTNPNKYK